MKHITNQRTKEKISITGVCDTFWKQTRGLMFSSRKNVLFCFQQEKKRGFHMFFVFFPIDIIFLDASKKIVEIKTNFLPYTTYQSRVACQYVIELPTDKKNKKNIRVGDSFIW